jgi:uncharacterized protein (TIGR03083 family)
MTAPGGDHTLPAGMRERVLAAAVLARAAGHPQPAPAEISPLEAYRRSVDSLDALLGTLPADAWRRPALRGMDVQGLVGHLAGVAEDVRRGLAGDPAVAEVSHIASTQPAAARQAGRPPDQTRAEWRRAADSAANSAARLAAAGDDLAAEVAVHRLRLPLELLLIVLAFELWVHENDIRAAAGMPPSVPDASRLRLMTEAAAGLLPFAAARSGLSEPANVHLVLTGPGGGTWDVPVPGPAPGAATVMIVTEAVGFCRLVANRVTPDMLGTHVTGDPDRAAAVLAAAPALALD